METKLFPSKKDTRLVAAVGGTTFACLLGSSLLLTVGTGGLVVAMPLLLLGVGLPMWLLVATDYRFEGKTLLVRGGPFRWRIRVHEINTVRPTQNLLSSPALSPDRLCIDYGDGKSLMISPCEVDTFLCELQARGGPPLSGR